MENCENNNNDRLYRPVGVAILDTGIFRHIDFDNRIIAFKDFVNGQMLPYDDNNHGSHVSGIIASSGRASEGRYRGVAPKSNIISVKVLDKNGNGKVSNVLKGLQWILDNREKYNIRILNISFGTEPTSELDENSLLIKGVEKIWDSGIVVVTAAGNNGPDSKSITVPGISRKVITVGAYDDVEYRDENGIVRRHYSGRGPTQSCIVKPEIVTAGTDIVSCLNNRNGYSVKSGTSMAAPICSGAIALLLEKYPNLSPKEVKMRIHDRAVKVALPKNQQGWGMLSVENLLKE